MAILNILGFEHGDLTGAPGTGGTSSIQSTTKRTGDYAMRANPGSSAAGYAYWTGVAASGNTNSPLGRTAETFYTFYFRFASIPSGTARFLSIESATPAEVVRLNIDSSGNITLTGTSTSSTVATISAGTWYRADLRVTSNSTSGLAIDGGTEQTVTANNITQDRVYFGRRITTEAVAFDCFYDDAVISDSAFATTPQIVRLDPTGSGNYSSWTSGTGTTFAEVDEDLPGHDSDTTYIKALDTDDNLAHTFAMEDASTAGVVGTIACVKNYAVTRGESTTGTSSAYPRLRSSTTDSDATGFEWGTTYSAKAKLHATDPATAAAWTSSGIDGIECGVGAGTLAQAQRCTRVYAEVLSDGVVPAAATFTGWVCSRGGWR